MYKSNNAEQAEQRRARNIRGKYFNGMRQMFLGQYTVRLNILLSCNVEEFFDKWYLELLTNDHEALQRLGYDIADEQLMDDIKYEFDRMTRIMRTNGEIDDMFDNHGESYVNGFYLQKYELISTDIIEPINPLTRRQRNTQKIDMCYYYINTELDLSQKTFKDSIKMII